MNNDKNIFWSEKFVEDYKSKNKEKRVGSLKWHSDKKTLIKAFTKCLTEDYDLILSEITPDELPYEIYYKDIIKFREKFLFIPPHNNPIENQISNNNFLLIEDRLKDDDNLKLIDLCISTIRKDNELEKVFSEDIDREWIKKIENSKNIFGNIIIKSKNNQLIQYFIIYAHIKNLNLHVFPSINYHSTRYLSCGIIGLNTIQKREFSLRLELSNFCKTNKIEICSKNTSGNTFNKSHTEQFEILSSSIEYDKFSKNLFRNNKKINRFLPLILNFSYLKEIRIIMKENIFPKSNNALMSLLVENLRDIFEFYDKDVLLMSQYLTEYSCIDIEFFENELKNIVCSIFKGQKQLSFLHQIGQSLLFLNFKSDFNERDNNIIIEIAKSYFKLTEDINGINYTSHALKVIREVDSDGTLNLKNVTIDDILESIYFIPILVSPNNLSEILLLLSNSTIPLKYQNSYLEKSLFSSISRILSENISTYNLHFIESIKNDTRASKLFLCVLKHFESHSHFEYCFLKILNKDEIDLTNYLKDFSLRQIFILLYYLNHNKSYDSITTVIKFIYTNFEHNNTLLSLLSYFPNDQSNFMKIKNYFSSIESINDALLVADKIDFELIVYIFYELSLSNAQINSDDFKIDYFDSLIYFQN